MPSQLAIYLRTHEASATAAANLARRAADSQGHRPYAGYLVRLAEEARLDHDALRDLMRYLAVSPAPVQRAALALAERVGRLKPNGHLVGRAPLSDLIEVEGLLDAAYAKATVWRALEAAGVVDGTEPVDLAALIRRADEQAARLTEIHRPLLAAEVLGAR